jgi:parvulin-like peptidyl-prolyl isomerase
MYGFLFSQTGLQNNVVLAEVGDETITLADLVDRINAVPEMHRTRQKSVDGQSQILDLMVTELMFYKRARDLGIDQLDEVKQAIHLGLQPVINSLYFEYILDRDGRFNPDVAEIFYQNNLSSYTIPPRITIQLAQISRAQQSEVATELAKGTDFEEVIRRFSISESRSRNGIIQNVRLNGFINDVGHDMELNNAIADASIDQDSVVGPVVTENGIYYFKKLSREPAFIRPFSEVRMEIIQRQTMMREGEVYARLTGDLRTKYGLVFHRDRLDRVNLHNLAPEDRGIVIAEGRHPDLTLTVAVVSGLLRQAAMNERADIGDPRVQESIINRELESRLVYAAAQEAGFLTRLADHHEVRSVKVGTVLSFYHRYHIMNEVEITQEELLEFYHENAQRYTVPPSRNIRQFVAKDERSARKHRTAINKLLKRNREVEIQALIARESLVPEGQGLLSHIYQNNIIPGLGVDEVYNAKVWEQRVSGLSPIFRNRNNQIVFFYVVSEEPAFVRPLHEVEASLMNIIQRNKVNVVFERQKNEMIAAYNVSIHFDRLVSMITPEELFLLAEDAQRRFSFGEAVAVFDQVISEFPDTEHAYRALFMKAFVTAEEVKDRDRAIALFEELLRKYPVGDLNESAQYMLEELKSGSSFEFMFLGN